MHQEKRKKERRKEMKKIDYLTNSRGENKSKDLLVITEEREDGTKHFELFVYRTFIASYDTRKPDALELADKWDYTRTTSRAVYEFITCYTWLSVRAVNGCVYHLFDLMMNAKSKKSLLTWLINSGQINIFNVDVVEERGF